MGTKNAIAKYAAYNLWANQQLINWLAPRTQEELDQEVPSSYSSILKTLNHIWAVEEYWYACITGTEVQSNRYGLQHLGKEEVFGGLIARSEAIVQLVDSLSEAELAETVEVISPWFHANLSRGEYLHHICNHGTYHRGQVVTIGRNIDVTGAPMTDYMFFSLVPEVSA